MKNLKTLFKLALLITAYVLLPGCQKEWQCTTTSSIQTGGQTYTGSSTQTVHGNKDEMEAYKEQNTKNAPGYTAVTECN